MFDWMLLPLLVWMDPSIWLVPRDAVGQVFRLYAPNGNFVGVLVP